MKTYRWNPEFSISMVMWDLTSTKFVASAMNVVRSIRIAGIKLEVIFHETIPHYSYDVWR